ncbi:MAG: mechanosensitive ion channel family protein, partial [Bauldia litoralis]
PGLTLAACRTWLAGILVLTTAVVSASADAANPLAPLDTSSPSATFQSFVTQANKIEARHADYVADKTSAKAAALVASVDRMRRLLDLEGLPPATRDKIGGAAFGYLADILVRIPEVPAAAIPGAPGKDWGTLPEKWRIPGTEIAIARVKDGLRAGDYLFTGESVEQLPAFHALIIADPPLRPTTSSNWHNEGARLTGPFFPDSLIRSLPEPLQRTLLDTPAWKIVLASAIGVLVLVVTGVWAMLMRRIAGRSGHAAGLFFRLTTPLLLAGLTYFSSIFIQEQVNVSGDFGIGESLFAAAVFYVAGAWAAWIACFLIVEAIIASPSIPDNSYDAHLLRLIARVGAVIAAGAIIVWGANDIGIPALGLVAGLGVGGFALALASQSTVENLFGGVSIFADRPFRVGDFINYGAGGGRVEVVGPRSSRIRALDGTLITVPNGDLAKMHITNYSRRDKCLFLHTLGLRYETSPEQFQWLLEALSQRLGEHPMVGQGHGMPRVALTSFGDSSINIELRAYILTSDYAEFLAIQGQLILDIMGIVAEAGTGFAFPSQTAYLARDTGVDETTKTRIEEKIRQRQEAQAVGDGEARETRD